MKVKSLVDQVYDYVLNRIKFGELSAGEKIDDIKLSEELGISRTPAREALLLLASDKVIENIPRKGFFVRTRTYQQALDAYVVVACLETFAIKSILDKLNKDNINYLDSLIKGMETAITNRTFQNYYTLQEEFHMYCVDMTENEALKNAIVSIERQFPRQTTCNEKNYDLLEKANTEHREILNAMNSKDMDMIEKLLSKHWFWPEENDES